jgi:HEAT repeat protein
LNERADIRRLLSDGDVWRVGVALSAAAESEIDAAAREILDGALDVHEIVDVVSDLAFPPEPPILGGERQRLLAVEAMGLLAARLAGHLSADHWRNLTPALSAFVRSTSPYRVQQAAVSVLAIVARGELGETRGFWVESLAADDSAQAASALRALSESRAPVEKVLEIVETVVLDSRKAVCEALTVRTLPPLARRDARAVFERLWRWAGRHEEMARWNVARALATEVGGMLVEDAVDILAVLAADERDMVWRAAAEALAEVAQRNPGFVLPQLAKWREDIHRMRAAEMALRILAKR